ncbi:GDP-mannose-dependent alpha-mannosyltransferase [termite gut metagenome]|uniref:GDP-mannose-dependent alpha-mannosyltransferase n=1 Tax=termite gut metagenome TaxID=433724 RepID=A0A5J4RXS9_9ZZZZ
MRILLSNKFYYLRGGDCVYTLNLESLLKKYNHEVAIFAMQHPKNIDTYYSSYFPSEVSFHSLNRKNFIELFLRPYGTREVKEKFNLLLDDFHPDIVHLNNIHSQLSPIIAQIAYQRKIKVIWTLHDYELLFSRYDGSHIRNLRVIDKIRVLKKRYIKNFIAYGESLKWGHKKLEKYTNLFICPSQFMTDKMIQGGINPQKLHMLYNFIDVSKTKRDNYHDKNDFYCYIGRLSHEKGVKTLVDAAFQLPYKLKIIGEGPLTEQLMKQANGSSNIEFLGYRHWSEIKEIVSRACFSVIPSEWHEVFGLVIAEAQCLGTPVLGANIGGIPELIENKKNGMLFKSGNIEDLTDKIQQMFHTEFDYKKIAEESQNRYSAENYYNEIMKIYTNID